MHNHIRQTNKYAHTQNLTRSNTIASRYEKLFDHYHEFISISHSLNRHHPKNLTLDYLH